MQGNSPIVIRRRVKVKRTPRVNQLESIFDLPVKDILRRKWKVELPSYNDNWQIGLIVGPSGSGKSVIANELYPMSLAKDQEWSKQKSIVDHFPKGVGIKDIVKLLNSVGFSSPPSWLKPYHILSTGEKFRVSIARSIAEANKLLVVDEFTSVVDRRVARIGSHSIAKTIRRSNKKFIAVTCHKDVTKWLDPDWVYKPHLNKLVWRLVRRKPEIKIKFIRTNHEIWPLFRSHHYLSETFNKAARVYIGIWKNEVVVMLAILSSPPLKDSWRAHRTVCLPDYQGVGFGGVINDFVGSMCKALNIQYRRTFSHPAVKAFCLKSQNWVIDSKKNIGSDSMGVEIRPTKKASTHVKNRTRRVVYGARYVGPAMDKNKAKQMWNSPKYELI